MQIVISLKDAPTDNRRLIFAPWQKRMVSSSAFRDWKIYATHKVKAQWNRKPLQPTFDSQLAYRVKVYMASRRTDQVNWDKGARDVLTEAGVWEDDKWAFPIYEACEIDKENPRMEIEIL